MSRSNTTYQRDKSYFSLLMPKWHKCEIINAIANHSNHRLKTWKFKIKRSLNYNLVHIKV